MNKVQTFDAFNMRRRRPNRSQHLRNCGFEIRAEFDPVDGKIRNQVLDYLNQLTKETDCFYHAVTLNRKNYNGWTYYEIWAKAI